MAALRDLSLAQVRVSERVQALVRSLESPSFAEREAASRALLDGSIADPEILALLDRGTLGDEAHERLLRVAVRRALERPRGALGVRMANAAADRPGVLVQQTIPGLPADGVLMQGDVIERINDAPVRSTEELADALQMLAPGAEVLVVVLRDERDAQGRPVPGPDGQPMRRRREFRMALGNAADLDKADPMPQGAWPPGMRNANLPLDRRRAQALMIEARFARALPPATVVSPAEEVDEDRTSTTRPDRGIAPGGPG